MKLLNQIQKKKRRTVHSISFKDDDLKIIKLAAQQEGISFASFIKNATLEYIKESLEYQRLVESGALKEDQQARQESLGTLEDTVKNTLLSINENVGCKLKKIEWLIEKALYYEFYFNRPTLEEERENMAKLAKFRMKVVMEGFKTEPEQGNNPGIEQKSKDSEQEH